MEQQNKIKILALMGKSASGKDTIQNCIIENYPTITNKVVSYTTRPPRQGEQKGVDYYFLNPEQFLQKVNDQDILEYTTFRGWYYGTAIDQLDKNKINVGVFNPGGVRHLLADPRLDVKVIYVQASDKVRLMRSLNREETPDCKEICRRFATDEADFENLFDIPYKIWDNNITYRIEAAKYSYYFWFDNCISEWAQTDKVR